MIPQLANYPLLTLVFTLVLMWVAMRVGQYLGRREPSTDKDSKGLDLVTSASLTLLALIIGFSFSMAVGRYDLRKNYEEEEANAIGTEYVRADLLPAVDAESVRLLLRQYLDERVMFYRTRDSRELQQ